MKNTILIIVLFFLGCTNSKGNKFSGNSIDDIKNFLEQEIVLVDIIDDVKTNPKHAELTLRLQKAMQEHRIWFQEYIQQSEEGKPLKYHPNFEISEIEYEEFLNLSNGIDIESSGKEKLELIKSDSTITFLGKGRLSLYNDITIDLKSNSIIYKDYILGFKNKIIVNDAKNGFRSKWKGYTWEFESQVKQNDIDSLNLKNLNLTILKFTIGQLDKDEKIYMELKEDKVIDGVRIIQNQLPIIF